MSPSALEHGLVPEGLVHRDIRFRQPVNIVEARDTLSLHVPTEKIAISSNEWIFTLEGNQKVLEWFTPICKNLCQLLDLPPNWDSYGALPIEPYSVATALYILNETFTLNTPRPAIVPTNNGGIQLEWHMEDIGLEIEIDPRLRGGIFYDDGSGKAFEKEGNPKAEISLIKELLTRMAKLYSESE